MGTVLFIVLVLLFLETAYPPPKCLKWSLLLGIVVPRCVQTRTTKPKVAGSTPAGRTILTRDESRDEELMAAALDEARRGLTAGEVPVGAVVVVAGEIIGRAHNAPVSLADPTAHAEVLALREAARKTGNYRLTGATLYATVEPCPMCCGAALNARVGRLVYGAADAKAGAVESLYRLLDDPRLNHRVATRGGVMARDAAALLATFFESKRR